jgi:hypothetical protein
MPSHTKQIQWHDRPAYLHSAAIYPERTSYPSLHGWQAPWRVKHRGHLTATHAFQRQMTQESGLTVLVMHIAAESVQLGGLPCCFHASPFQAAPPLAFRHLGRQAIRLGSLHSIFFNICSPQVFCKELLYANAHVLALEHAVARDSSRCIARRYTAHPWRYNSAT